MLHGPVLVGTNLKPGSEHALLQGARIADGLDAPLIVCHVMPELLRIGMLFPQWRGVNPALVEAMRTKARDAVSRQIDALLADRNLPTEIVIESGTPHVGVMAQAVQVGAGVIVIGPGDVAAQIARTAQVPVVVARPSPARCVVAATDFSDPSLHTIQLAASEARRRQVPLHVIHVLDLGFQLSGGVSEQPYLDGLAGVALDGVEELHAAAEQRLKDLLREFDVEGQIAVVIGRAERAIVAYAEEVGAAVVVLGRHGGSGFAPLTLGSTATQVIEQAPCSVLVSRVSAPPSLAVVVDTDRARNPVPAF